MIGIKENNMTMGHTSKSNKTFLSLVLVFFVSVFILQPSSVKADTGLVAHWAMDDGSGNIITDSSGNGNDENVNGTASWVIGKINGALSFDGSTNYAHASTFNNPPSSTMTLCSWIKTSSATRQVILGFNRNSGGFSNEGIFEVLSSGAVHFWDYGGAGGFSYNDPGSTGTVDDGHWHLVCFVKNNKAGTYYIDGVASGTTTAAINVAYDNYDWVLGKDYRDNTSYFHGLMDDMRVYNIALTPDQISGLYGLLGYWKFDEGSGSTAFDSSGNGNDGTLYNNPSWVSGKLNGALQFDGGSSYVEIPDAPILEPSSSVTVAAWVYAGNFSQNSMIITKNPVNTDWQLFLETGPSGEGSGGIKWRSGSGTPGIVAPFPTDGEWHQVTAVQSGTTATLYIDGASVASGAVAALGITPGTIDIGRFDNNFYYNGIVDDVRIYGRALSNDEVLNFMEFPPHQVSNFQATGRHATGFSLTWDQNPIGDSVTDYVIQYSSDAGNSWTTVDTASTSTSYVLSNLPPGDYLFNVKAVNSIGQSPVSNQIEINSPVITYSLDSDCVRLENIANNPGDAYGHYVMSANIDCSSVPNFSPINFSGGFGGIFDGEHYTITNLNISTTTINNVGLFSQTGVGASVENLNITNATVTSASDYTGILVGYNNGTLQNISVSGTSTGPYSVGGLVGRNDSLGTISSSSAGVYVTGDAGGGNVNEIGGFVGENEGSIDHSYATGAVVVVAGTDRSSEIGGFVGYSQTGNFSYDYTTGAITILGDISGDSGYIGGFGGEMDSATNIDNSYATGSISDPDDNAYELGGFVGDTGATFSYDHATGDIYLGDDGAGDVYYVGGFAGGTYSNPITNCYSTGSITAAHPEVVYWIGGFSGYEQNNISYSYSTGSVVGNSYIGGFSPYNTGTLSEVFAIGNVVAYGNNPSYIAGLVADNDGGSISDAYSTSNISMDSGVTGNPTYIGGLIAYNSSANINHAYSSGVVQAGDNSSIVGGLIGEDVQSGNSINNSYSVGTVSGGVNVGGIVGLEYVQGAGNPSYIDLAWYTGSVSNVIGDFQNNSGTDNGPIANLVTGGYGTDENTLSNFYTTTEPVYAQGQGGAWDFSSVWNSHTNALPTFNWFDPAVATYTITASAGTGGSISPSGGVSVNSGENQNFIISSNNGYSTADVLVDSSSVGAIATYTFSNVTATHTISASFRPNPVNQVTPGSYSGGGSVLTYENPKTSIKNVVANSTLMCSDKTYPTKQIKFGSKNDPYQVRLLEEYLNTFENANLPITGVYSKQDEAAVMAWQEKFAPDILTPWHLTKGTGYIYKTSLQKFKSLFLRQCESALDSTLDNQSSKIEGSNLSRDLTLGMSGSDVKSLQQILISKNIGIAAQALAKKGATGYFGELTKSALIEFQKSVGFSVANGIYSSKTKTILSTQ